MTVSELTKQEIAEMLKPKGLVNPEKFYNVLITADTFCQMHAISYPTLIRWIQAGLVESESRDIKKGKHYFRLSYALRFDVTTIKGKAIKYLHKKTA